MAYIIVLEGQHKSGKSTLARQLEELASRSPDWRTVIRIHHTRGDSTREKLAADKNMIEDAPGDTLYIFDRHYLSELVYAPVDGRASTIPYDPLYWEQYLGKWTDQRGVRLYLMGEPIHSNNNPVAQMYERLTAQTNWQRVQPREFIGTQLAKDVLQAVTNRRLQNETWGFAQEPKITAEGKPRQDDNHLQSIETASGLERNLYSLRNADGDPQTLHESAIRNYRELMMVRAEMDNTLLKPFRIAEQEVANAQG